MTHEEILDAAKATLAARGRHYGGVEDNFSRVARLWNAHLLNTGVIDGTRDDSLLIRPEDVAVMMALLKIARLANDPAYADNWVDLAGYAACGGSISVA